MKAVTIAVGSEYERLAVRAAESFRRHTGLDTVILSPATTSPPQLAKFRLLDIFREPILYFDADTYCLRPWDLRQYEAEARWVAVPDLPGSAITAECARYNLDANRYWNAGLWIANPQHHTQVLHRAAELMAAPGWQSQFIDQTALNLAVQQCGIPLLLLDRRFNVITAAEAQLPPGPIVIHAAGGGTNSPNRTIFERLIPQPASVEPQSGTRPPELTVDTAADQVQQCIESQLRAKHYPADRFSGRGIVIAAGGPKFQIGAWVTIRMLRMLGCQLPIECWYLGSGEYNAAWAELVRPYDVACVDAYEVRKQYPHARLHGWELKPYAIQHSRFREVLFLDADNVPVRDPTYLFDTPQFQEWGTIFWPDFGRLGRDRLAWRVFGNIPCRDEPEVESGQIVLDKARCWRALELCHWYMQNSSNFYFRHVHGDKEVFHLAWRKLGLDYAMPSRGIDALPGVMCQHDFEGNRVFQHRNMRKWSFYHNPTTPGFRYEEDCLRLIAELRQAWSPAAQTLPSEADLAAIAAMDSRAYEYHRVGHDHRPMVFRGDGTFAAGDAGCERYWTIRDGRLLIAGDDGRLTMDLTRTSDGGWEGKWLVHEKMPIRLEPKL